MTDAPERIGLKLSEGYEHNDYSVVTYHFDEEGVEYVRADLYAAAQARIEALEAQIADMNAREYRTQVQRYKRAIAILRGEKP